MIPTSLLVIDDNEDSNYLVKFVLEQDTNWQILTASDGEKGITIAKYGQPSVILLDVIMPNLNGLDVYNLLKSDPRTRSIPIIFMTAMVRMEAIIQLQIAEKVEVIIKPFDIVTLKNRITNVCDRCLNTEVLQQASPFLIFEPLARKLGG